MRLSCNILKFQFFANAQYHYCKFRTLELRISENIYLYHLFVRRVDSHTKLEASSSHRSLYNIHAILYLPVHFTNEFSTIPLYLTFHTIRDPNAKFYNSSSTSALTLVPFFIPTMGDFLSRASQNMLTSSVKTYFQISKAAAKQY